MVSPTQGWLRGLRAGSLGVVGLVLALVAHVAAGGAAPGPVVLIVLAGLTGLAAVLLTRVRLGPVRVGMSLTAMQVVLHELFMRVSSPACQMTGMRAPASGHLSHGAPMLHCATGMARAGMGQRSVLAATAMVGAHVMATAVLAAAMAHGEKVLWLLAGWVDPPRWLRVGLAELPAVRVVSVGAPQIFRMRLATGGVGRRGPPAWGLFAIG